MGRLLEIDWEEVRKIANSFKEQTTNLKDAQKSLNEWVDSVDGVWKGVDADNYKNNIKSFVNEMETEISYLTIWTDFLLKSSDKYNSNVDNFLSKLNEIEAKL